MGDFPSDFVPVDGHDPIMTEGWRERLREILAARNMSMKDVSLKARLGETFMRDILERGREPGIEKIAKIAGVLGVTVSEILLEGPSGAVPIVGLAGAGPEGSVQFAESQGILGSAPMPPGGSPKTVAVEVRGSSMRGIAEDGWFVYYDNRRDPPTDDMLGELCVVGLSDGKVLIKRLIRGRRKRHFDLESASAPTMHDAKVDWAALVIAIIPRRQALRLRDDQY